MKVNVRGIILAGGHSRRFGSDKALAQFEGSSLIERAGGLLSELDLDPVIVTNRNTDYSFTGFSIIHDIVEDQGPLGGLYTALSHFQDSRLCVLTCDTPMITKPVIKMLLQANDKSHDDIILFDDPSHLQVFPGIYAPGLLEHAEISLKNKQTAMHEFIGTISRKKMIPFSFDPIAFQNVNYQADLKVLLETGTYSGPR